MSLFGPTRAWWQWCSIISYHLACVPTYRHRVTVIGSCSLHPLSSPYAAIASRKKDTGHSSLCMSKSQGFSKRWFSCSFEDVTPSNSVSLLSPATASCSKLVTSAKQMSLRNHNNDETLLNIAEIDDDEPLLVWETPKISLLKPAQSSCYESLIDRFPPTNVEHLAVHSKKVDQVREWMLNHRDGMKRSKILLLTGPCGSGKTATVKVLCSELRMKLVEWESPDHYEFAVDENGEEILCEQSQVRVFADFLKSVDRNSLDDSCAQRVVLIEHLPNIFYREPGLLHSLLCTYTLYSRCMFIFVLSSIESCWTLNPRRLFPMSMLRDLHFDTVTFNPSALTFLSKAIRRILSELKIKATSTQIKYIAESAAGDIRCAINNLQLCIGDDGQLLKDAILFGSSSQTDPFHSIGRILHGKRAEQDSNEWLECENLLSKRLRERFHRPRPPKDVLEDVIQKTAMSGDNIAAYLEEHEPYFVKSLSDLRAVFDNISLMDSSFGSWEVRMNNASSEYEAEVAARSTIFYNYGIKYNSSRGLHSLSKPRWWETQKRIEMLTKEVRAIFPGSVGKDFFTLTLPMMSRIDPPLDICQRHFLTVLNSRNSAWARPEFGNVTSTQHQRTLLNGTRTAMEEDGFDIEEVEGVAWRDLS
uniref:Cell cycle checkpoint protein RAD17 n=1 Tax=Ascaris suum TaxID=6253 RepID=F1L066_ASCSU